MSSAVDIDTKYRPSEEVVAREIEGEIIIVPLTSGVADMEDALYTLNETGRSVWMLLDGKRTLREVIQALNEEYEPPPGGIEEDVRGLLAEMLNRGIVVEAAGG